MKNVCFLCDGELVFNEWYGVCGHCRILIPESKERMIQEINSILDLRTELREHLYDLEQKQISYPDKMTEHEKEERDLWTKYNVLYNELIVFMNKYDIVDIRHREVYPRLYYYVPIIDQIKRMYRKNE